MGFRESTSGEAVRQRIIEEVAATRGADAMDLDPLYDAVDPDAVGALVEQGFAGRIEFRFAGCRVVVEGDGRVRAEANRHGADPSSIAREFESE